MNSIHNPDADRCAAQARRTQNAMPPRSRQRSSERYT